jgi:hypothetical protein
MVEEPAEPKEIKGELVSAMGELKDMMRRDEEMEGRDENYYDENQQVSQPITTNIAVMYIVDLQYQAVKNTEVEDMYWMAASATKSSSNIVNICNSRQLCPCAPYQF